jgi:L-threonine-O-3-phosphate decarboxylase
MHGGNRLWAARLAGRSPHAILDFSASINPLGPPATAIAAIQTALIDVKAYPDPEYGQLCKILAQHHQISADWVLPGNGSAELLTWACRELAALSGTCLLTPAFGDYSRALQAFDGVVYACPLFNDRGNEQQSFAIAKPLLDLSRVLDPLIGQLPTQSYGLLLNNPHNPTGWLFSAETIVPYLERFALIVIDEAFMDFLPLAQQQSLIDQVQRYSNLIILRSLTKFYSLPGLRLGYAIAHPDQIQRWQQWRDPWPVNVLAAAAGVSVVQDTCFQRQTWEWLAATQPQMFQGLSALPGLSPYPSSANFFLVRSNASVKALQQQLLQTQGILIRDCLSFPELGDRYFRVAIRTDAENARLLASLGALHP